MARVLIKSRPKFLSFITCSFIYKTIANYYNGKNPNSYTKLFFLYYGIAPTKHKSLASLTLLLYLHRQSKLSRTLLNRVVQFCILLFQLHRITLTNIIRY